MPSFISVVVYYKGPGGSGSKTPGYGLGSGKVQIFLHFISRLAFGSSFKISTGLSWAYSRPAFWTSHSFFFSCLKPSTNLATTTSTDIYGLLTRWLYISPSISSKCPADLCMFTYVVQWLVPSLLGFMEL